ncbi:putative 6-phosphogluconolactonase [Lachnellula occidentalis]|uniref:Putative 6-phosphogluconolactonase n=1 Tax=Lachnellula occidentalis TaxID=215460 RepID=A0A8H8S8L4_9HELO|nr:putative 6-phosphogluconolactonase [Lachnellula occidentalis]
MRATPSFLDFYLPAPLRPFAFASLHSVERFLDIMRWQHLPLGGLVASSVAVNLYVSSYVGNITTLSLCQDANGNYSLTAISANNGSSPSPTWLEKDKYNGIIYGLDEGLTTPNGSITAYKTSASGELTQIDQHVTLGGPVSSIVYNGGKGIALAHYGGSALSSWTILQSGGLTLLQNFQFTLSAPGTDPDRQDAPHPHEALVDPTDQFIVVPDLGADYIRVFSIDPQTSVLTERTSFSTPPGSGPRHGAFFVNPNNNNTTYFFLVTELGNTVSSYEVSYDVKNNLGFTEVSTSGIYGNKSTPIGAAAAEGILSPDNKYFLTSCRNDSTFTIPNFDPTNSTSIQSDSLQSWEIDPRTGKLAFVQLAPAGGSFPRQFSVSKDGTLAAVGMQESARVVIVERDVEDGRFGRFVAEVDVPGEVTSVIWDE